MNNLLQPLDFDSRQALFASIVESSEDAIITKTLDGNITSWNKSAERLLGYQESEVIGKHISLLIPGNRLNEEDTIIAAILRGERIDNFRTIRKTKNGTEFDASLTVSPMFNKRGEVIGASKILRDISQQVAMENKLIENNLELQRLNLYKDDFIALVGHELRTPLTSLQACLQLAQSIPGRQAELIEKAEQQVKRISLMLTDLQDIAQMQSGRMEIHPVVTNINDIVKNACEIAAQALPSHKIQYQPYKTPVWVAADVARIEQVIINLLTNAVKYSPGKDKVLVKVLHPAGSAEVAITDFGLGIPANDLEKIWTRFYRVPAHRNRVRGLGIGLHLCRQLVKAHKGSIWAESEEGNGSTFRMRLPVRQ